MKKDVLIHVRGLQMMDPEEEQEPIEIVVPGQYYYRNGSHYLRYEEMMDDTAEPTVNYIKMSAQGDSSANGACSQREPIPLQRARAASMAAGSSNFRASQKSVSSSPRPHFRASEAAFSSIPERNNFPRKLCMPSPHFQSRTAQFSNRISCGVAQGSSD